jgi:hypothetical protein
VSTAAYVIDPDDPRAPTVEQWAAMSPAERAAVAAALPTDMPWDLHPPEGDSHREPKLESLVDELIDARDMAVRRAEMEAERAAQEAERAAREAHRADEESRRRRALEAEVAALKAELERRGR